MVPKRLVLRLILSLTAILVLAEGAFGVASVRQQERQLLDSMMLGADLLSRAVSGATWHAMLADDRQSAYLVMRAIAQNPGIDRIRIFNKEGRVTFSTAATEAGGQVDKRAEACFLCHAEARPLVRVDVPSRARVFRTAEGRRRLGIVTPIYNEPACSSAPCHAHPQGRHVLGVLDVALDLSEVDAQLSRIRWRVVLAVALEVGLIGVFIVFFSRRFVGTPIRRLTEGARRVSAMELDEPIRSGSGGEMALLAKALDDMRIRLKESLEALENLNRTLEARVEERSRQLQAAQEKLAQSGRLASLGRLSATVAHEINNPLSGILNLSMLMRRLLGEDGVPPDRLHEFRSHLDQVVRETERVGRMVRDLLVFSRQAKPVVGRVDLNDVVQRSLSLVSHHLDMQRAKVTLGLDPGLPAVLGDPSQLQQVVMNLVLNAAEALSPGGEVEIRTLVQEESGAVLLEVRDTGRGMPESLLPHVFEPFYTTKEAQGTGLGLAVVYGIVRAHGGDIDIQSEEGRGTLVRVTLPAGREQAAGATRADGEEP